MSQNQHLKSQTAAEIRLTRDMERQINNDAGRAKIIETFAEIQEAEAKGLTQPSWENDENQEEYNFIFRNGQEFNVIAPTLDFAKTQCEMFLNDPANPRVGALPNESDEFKKAFEAEDEEDKKHYFKIIEDSEGNVIGEEEIFPDAPAKPAKKSKSKKK